MAILIDPQQQGQGLGGLLSSGAIPQVLQQGQTPVPVEGIPQQGGMGLGGMLPQDPQQGLAQQMPPTPPEAPQRSGMFGLKGTLRDVLGSIGDAFLVQSGNKPMYSQARQREALADAARGFETNPIEAIQRMNEAGFTQEAAALYDNYQKRATAQAQAQIQSRKAEAEIGGLQDTAIKNALGMISQADERTYPAIRDMITRTLSARNIELPFELPEEFDADAIAAISRYGVSQDKQISQDNLRAYRESRLADYDEDRQLRDQIARQQAEDLRAYRESVIADKAEGRTIQRDAAANAAPKKGQRRVERSPSTGQTRTTEWTGSRWKVVGN